MTAPSPARTADDPLGAIDLGPDLPPLEYTCAERWQPERIGALALYCSDGRWGEAFDEFCHKHLLIPRYDRWAVPGGPAWLAFLHFEQRRSELVGVEPRRDQQRVVFRH